MRREVIACPLRAAVSHCAGRTASERPSDFLDLVGLENVALFQIVEASQLEAAFQSFAYLARIILLALERLHRIVADDAVFANQAHAGVALHHAGQHSAASDRADAADRKGALH